MLQICCRRPESTDDPEGSSNCVPTGSHPCRGHDLCLRHLNRRAQLHGLDETAKRDLFPDAGEQAKARS
jgi:hypothetical protein